MGDKGGGTPQGSAQSRVGNLVARFEGFGVERSHPPRRLATARYLSSSPAAVRHPTAMACAQDSPCWSNFIPAPHSRAERPRQLQRRGQARHAPTLLQASPLEKSRGHVQSVGEVGQNQEPVASKAQRCSNDDGIVALMELVSLFDDPPAGWEQATKMDKYSPLVPRGLSADFAASTAMPARSAGLTNGVATSLSESKQRSACEQVPIEQQGDADCGPSIPAKVCLPAEANNSWRARKRRASVAKRLNDWNARWQPRQRAAQMRALAGQQLQPCISEKMGGESQDARRVF